MLNSNSPNHQHLVNHQPEMRGAVAPYTPWMGGHGPAYGLEDEDRGFDPSALLRYVVAYRWMIGGLFVLGLIAGLVITWMTTPLFRATTRIEVMVPSAKVIQEIEIISETTDWRVYVTAQEKIRSRSVAQRVVFELGLDNNLGFLFPEPQFSTKNLLARAFSFEASRSLSDYTPEQREAIAIGRVLGNMSVGIVGRTSLLAISFIDQNPELAKDIANEIARSFINQGVDQTSETSDLARQFIEEQVAQVKEKLQTSEKALVDYAKAEGITITGGDMSLIAANIEQINEALSEAIQERLDYQRLVNQIDQGYGASLPQVLDSGGIQDLKQSRAELRAEYQQKRALLKPEFPEMVQLQFQINELDEQIKEAVNVVTNSIRLKSKETLQQEADLRSKLSELEAEQVAFQDKNIQYTILSREVDSNRAQYDGLIAKLNELGVGSELRRENTAVVDVASTPGAAFLPNRNRNIATALAFAALVAAALIYLRELMNNTFSVPDQIEAELKLPVLGILPRVSEDTIQEELSDPKSALGEAYRSLRTALQFTGTDGTPRSMLITSSEPSEGKSTTAFKLAQDFGSLGLQVLLIDADMRKPNVHRYFNSDNTVGLSNVLTNTVHPDDFKRIFRRSHLANLTYLCAGTIPPNPPDLLSSPKMAMLLQACTDRYDMVIVDSPPIIGLSDAPILARQVEGTLLVVSANQVTRKSSRASLKRLKAVGGHFFGAAMSKFAVKKYEYDYAYRYVSENYYALPDESSENDKERGRKRPNRATAHAATASERLRRTGDMLRGRMTGT